MSTTNELQGFARLTIFAGKLDEFKRHAKAVMDAVRTQDTGTLQYDWFFSSDHSECVVFERYRDSEALLEHLAHIGDTMAALLETCSVAGVLCGIPSPEVKKALEGLPIQIFSPFQSLTQS
jgi:quinol monooxygenase YgiN